MIEPKNYNFSNVKFFSPMQLSEHYALYTKYIDCLNKVNVDLKQNNIYSDCNQNYSNIRSAQKSKSFCCDAIKLHELYFENLTGNNTNISGPMEKIVKDVFGTYDNFLDKFKCIAMSMRGWVLFCYDKYNKEYYIYGQDSHDDGVMLYAEPLIVLDVYEHSYMIDYGINRSLYIDAFLENLDFGVVNKRLNSLLF
ncbi:MAG: Fe-Mn family superoxide dismutase [Sedimentibacter sp.]|uniref:superoxide dismutase n=1 Tax=Sedimentibacter sp. TaxID=1960295 RepID=UPI002981ED74|nr:Fe-Mn family superoxide dismutase [Sedimentibacter sp.]MDW5299282.1 Fe-Mn family superoxide dismutase [Sedimentibacter sp.]